jgi:hypothetical protein
MLVCVASVATVRAKPAALPSESARVAGLNEQLAFAGSPLQLRVTFPEYPADGLNDSAYVAGLPAVTVADALPPGCGVMVNVGWAPVPLSATLCGELAALSVTVMVAESAPVAAGVNTTLAVHELPALTVAPQLLVSAKLAASLPLTAIVSPVKSAFPEFFTETVWGAEATFTVCAAKVRLAGVIVTTGAAGGGGGAGAPIVKVTWPDMPPPLPGFTTVI